MQVIERQIRSLVASPTSSTSAGYPYLAPAAFRTLRDRVPLLFGMGGRVLDVLERLQPELDANGVRAARVIRQVVRTAAITAPPDLWLLHHLVGIAARFGIPQRLLADEAVYPDDVPGVVPHQLRILFDFLEARGVVEPWDDGVRLAGHPRARAVFEGADPGLEPGRVEAWRAALAGGPQPVVAPLTPRTDPHQTHWIATADEVRIGFELVPLVLALRGEGRTDVGPGDRLDLSGVEAGGPILEAAGWTQGGRVTELGARGLRRGPGPFGIIASYWPYLAAADALFRGEPTPSWVRRTENVAASQDANRATFARAHDQLDRFCEDTGFRYDVFIEHAVGKGEATRIRAARSDEPIAFFGADLEDAAIGAAAAERDAGRLPTNMRFIRGADIGDPARVVDAVRAAGHATEGAVMMVGNGFHEVRGQTDARMAEVFAGYARAGILLIFTEENALASDDLRSTAWNTYHAGFRYVHALSGQGLRPATRRPPTRSGHLLPTAWAECAERGGYLRAEAYCVRSRTIFPAPNPDGHNPSISVTHFLVPPALAHLLDGSGG